MLWFSYLSSITSSQPWWEGPLWNLIFWVRTLKFSLFICHHYSQFKLFPIHNSIDMPPCWEIESQTFKYQITKIWHTFAEKRLLVITRNIIFVYKFCLLSVVVSVHVYSGACWCMWWEQTEVNIIPQEAAQKITNSNVHWLETSKTVTKVFFTLKVIMGGIKATHSIHFFSDTFPNRH